jgi:hypothetical protein
MAPSNTPLRTFRTTRCAIGNVFGNKSWRRSCQAREITPRTPFRPLTSSLNFCMYLWIKWENDQIKTIKLIFIKVLRVLNRSGHQEVCKNVQTYSVYRHRCLSWTRSKQTHAAIASDKLNSQYMRVYWFKISVFRITRISLGNRASKLIS